ncbi:hypothetical protein M9H77_27006 [Catharanthus roseus]|uniref:Uncharacterized protein n=1 Tax=Catharanthus roseus TaxID=4058 RepID=A0ACC0ABA9_CATRO|nr:hypothetical protein M9H77_27006 [Catharanthus roseus]
MRRVSLNFSVDVSVAIYSSLTFRGIEGLPVTGPNWSVHQKQYQIEMIERLICVRLSLSHFSGYKVKKEPLEAWILREFTGSETDENLILRAGGFIFLLLGGHILPDFSGSLVHAVVHGSFRGYTIDRRSLSHTTDLGVVVYPCIAASIWRMWTWGLGSSYHVDPFDSPDLGMPSFSLGLTQPIQSHPPTSYSPLPLGTTSCGHWEFFILGTSSSRHNVVTPAQQLGFGHCVGKKTTRFTPSGWP